MSEENTGGFLQSIQNGEFEPILKKINKVC